MIGFKIHTVGFSSFEKSTIETFFRLAGRRAPFWELTSKSTEARVILLNATNQQDIDVCSSLLASWQKVIIVGASDYSTGWPVLPRPIKLTAILGLLDTITKEANISTLSASVSEKIDTTIVKVEVVAPSMVTRVQKPNMTDVFANITSRQTTINPVFKNSDTYQHFATKDPVAMTEATSYLPVKTDLQVQSSKKTSFQNTTSSVGRVLIVDDSEIALKFMKNRLQHYGYESDIASSGEAALAMVAKQSYQFIFLDVMMEGLDGYKTCRAIKSNKARRGPLPSVVMLTSRGGTIDKIRGNMAGCDAYLTKPLNEKKLLSVLSQFDSTTLVQRYDAVNPRVPLADIVAKQKRV